MSARVLLLFDLDGTLMLSGGAGGVAMEAAGREVYGPRLSWEGIDPAGGLDSLLLAAALTQSGMELCPEREREFQRVYFELLEAELEERRDRIRVLPGTKELLAGLATLDASILGLLTGNYGPSARAKLRAAGFDDALFEICAFGDEAPSRPALVARALDRAREDFGPQAICPARTLVIGDTPKDVHCARANDCIAVAVATGSSTRDELHRAGADLVLDDLSEPRALYDCIAARASRA